MRLQHTILLSLSFMAGLLVGRYYLPQHPTEIDSGALIARAPPLGGASATQAGPGIRGEGLYVPAASVGAKRVRGTTFHGWQAGSPTYEDDTHIERLQSEYAGVLRELQVSEADVRGLMENSPFAADGADDYSPDVELGSPAPEPLPPDLALDLERALVESGISDEEARRAADDLFEQMMLSVPERPDGGSDLSSAASSGEWPVP